jgi:MoaA/NifB/PqqE/SkfB family radical SAM enzyme
MANIYNNEISLAFDVYGCPQRCKHCWVGHPRNSNMNVEEVISMFSSIKNEHNDNNYYGSKVKYLRVDIREPHYGDNYKNLYNRVDEINGCSVEVDNNFELISLWRLVCDKDYVNWIKERGINKVQVKVFGLEETNDFFYGRKGAHKDLIEGTNILLNNGIIPRWQVYYNKKGINELCQVMELTHELNIWERVSDLGEKFNIHGYTFDSDGSGFINHNYRIEKGDEKKIPKRLWEKSKEHYGEEYDLKTEGELTKEILNKGEYTLIPDDHWLWFFVTSDWDVYPNFMGPAPWWKLGNLKENNWKTIVDNYKNNNNLGLKVMTEISAKELAKKYGSIEGEKLYNDESQLVEYWLGKYCREHY